MSFKKLAIFTLKDQATTIRKVIRDNAEVVGKYSFSECTAAMKKSIGFSKTIFGEFVSEDSYSNLHLKFTQQAKSPNKNEVNHVLEERVAKWAAEAVLAGKEPNDDGEYVPNKREMKELKESAEFEVLQRTFPQEAKHFNMMFRPDGLVLIESTVKHSEDIIALLRKALGSLPCFPLVTDIQVTDLLDDWIANAVSDEIVLGNKAAFYTQADGKVMVTGESIDSEECRKLLADGMMPVSVEFTRNGMITAVLKEDLTFDGIKFSDELKDQADGDEVGSFMLQTRELNVMVDDVLGRLTETA